MCLGVRGVLSVILSVAGFRGHKEAGGPGALRPFKCTLVFLHKLKQNFTLIVKYSIVIIFLTTDLLQQLQLTSTAEATVSYGWRRSLICCT